MPAGSKVDSCLELGLPTNFADTGFEGCFSVVEGILGENLMSSVFICRSISFLDCLRLSLAEIRPEPVELLAM